MAASYLESAEEDLTCPLCMEYFVDPHTPKELDCPHVYCYTCLAKMVETNPLTIQCPECRLVTHVPPKTRKRKGGVAALKTQLRLRSLAEKHMTHTESCLSLYATETERSLDVNRPKVPICPKHDGEKMLFYCMTCNEVVCQICILSKHERPEHDIHGVKVAQKEKLKTIKDITERCEQQLEKFEQKAREASQEEEDIHSAIAAAEQKIDEAVAVAMDKAIEQGQILKAELKKKNEQQLIAYQRQTTELNQKVCAMKDTLCSTHTAMVHSNCYEFLRQHDTLLDNLKIEELSVSEAEEMKTGIKVKQFSMIPNVDIKLGKLTAIRQLKLVPTTDAFNELLFGLASRPSGILAVGTRENSNVRVYDKQENGQYHKKFSFPLCETKDNNPGCDVAIADNGQYLVARKQYAEMYDTSGKFLSTLYTQEDNKTDNVSLVSISTTEDGRIILGDARRCVITVHSPDGSKLMKTVKTSIVPFRIAPINNTYIGISERGGSAMRVIDLELEKETLKLDLGKRSSVCFDDVNECILIRKWNGTEYVDKPYDMATGDPISPSSII